MGSDGKIMGIFVVFDQMIVFVILIFIGIFLNKRHMLDEKGEKTISTIIVNVCNPLLMISSCLSADRSASHSDIIRMIMISLCVYLFMIVLGFVLPWLLRIRKNERRFYNMMCVYGNIGFIGIPLVRELMGNVALVYVTIYNMIFCLLIYTHGKAVLGGENGFKPKDLLSTGFLGAIIAVLIYWFGITLPETIKKPIDYSGNATTFLSMIVLGSSLCKINLRSVLKEYKLHLFIAIKFVLVPIAVGLILKHTGLNILIVRTITIMTALPAANMPLMLAKEAGLKTETLTKGIGWSTILSLVTLTLVLAVV